jgi:predicted HicB family RNase H-like nuclease
MSRKKFTTTLDEELIKEIKVYAIEHDTSVSQLIEKAIKQIIKKP